MFVTVNDVIINITYFIIFGSYAVEISRYVSTYVLQEY